MKEAMNERNDSMAPRSVEMKEHRAETVTPAEPRSQLAQASRRTAANDSVQKWVDECAALCRPDKIVWCDGSQRQREELIKEGTAEGIFIPLNQQELPGCYLHR